MEFETSLRATLQGGPGWDGFLGTRASWMLDFVFVAMLFALVALIASIWLVRVHKAYVAHKWLQIVLSYVLLVTVVAFEVDMRLHGWKDRAANAEGLVAPEVWTALYIHLGFAISTALLWPAVLVRAWRAYPNPPRPSSHSREHRVWAWLAVLGLTMTTVTGWIFYWLAFVR